jgi:hypothetical protein
MDDDGNCLRVTQWVPVVGSTSPFSPGVWLCGCGLDQFHPPSPLSLTTTVALICPSPLLRCTVAALIVEGCSVGVLELQRRLLLHLDVFLAVAGVVFLCGGIGGSGFGSNTADRFCPSVLPVCDKDKFQRLGVSLRQSPPDFTFACASNKSTLLLDLLKLSYRHPALILP